MSFAPEPLCYEAAATARALFKISSAQISKIENGQKQISLDLRNKIMMGYGYSPTSFKNLASDPIRSRAVPHKLKLEIVLRNLNELQIEKVFQFAKNIFQNSKELELNTSNDGGTHGT